jgi:hypothetical protein
MKDFNIAGQWNGTKHYMIETDLEFSDIPQWDKLNIKLI